MLLHSYDFSVSRNLALGNRNGNLLVNEELTDNIKNGFLLHCKNSLHCKNATPLASSPDAPRKWSNSGQLVIHVTSHC